MSSAGSTAKRVLGLKKGLLPASDSRIGFPLSVPVLSWLFGAGKARKSRSQSVPGRHEAVARHVSGSSSPPTVGGLELGPRAQPSEPILFRSYGSILPTSLAYIVPSTRGCSPWRPDAVMNATGRGGFRSSGFSRARECTDTTRRADRLTHVQVPFTWNLSPLRPSKFSFEYLLLPPRSAPAAAPPGSRPRFCSDRAPSYSSRPGSCPAAGIGRASAPSISGLVDSAGSANQLPYALRVYSPVDSHTCQTPWSVFQGGSNGSPQAAPRARRCEARRGACCRPRLRQRRLRGRNESRA
ncbi:hypothetical protein Bca4012_102910 [Brassica carinata]